MKFKSINNKIIFTYVGVFFSTILLLNILVYSFSRTMIIENRKEILSTNRNYFINQIEKLHNEKRVISKKKIEEEIMKSSNFSGDFSIKISLDDQKSAGIIPIEISNSLKEENKIISIDGDDIDKEDNNEYFYFTETYNYDDSKFLIEYLLTSNYEVYLKILLQILVMVDLLGLVIALFTGIKLGKSITKPINDISDMTERITSNNLSERLPVAKGEDELIRLSKLINGALERLEISFDNQKKFISNISHELRTPVAVIKGYLDIYRHMGHQDEELVEEAISAIEEENENIRKMIEKLLFLARNDLDKFNIEKSDINSSHLLNKLKKDYSSFIEEPNIRLNISEDFSAYCNQDIVLQILRSLIDNAIKYAGENGIELGGWDEENRAILYVKDFGKGMTKEETQKIFERFYRGDSSRNRDIGSMGLGLSIVQKLCEIHKSTIEVESELGVGSTFKLILTKEEEKENEEDINSWRR